MDDQWPDGEPAILRPKAIDPAVVARIAADMWSADIGSVEHVSDGAAYTYRYRAHSDARFLRLTPTDWRTQRQVNAEVAFVRHVAACGLNVAEPVRSAKGRFVETVDGELHCTSWSEASGTLLHDRLPSSDQALAMGRVLGQLHAAAETFSMPPGCDRPSWRAEIPLAESWLNGEPEPILNQQSEFARWLERLPRTPEVFGLVHHDVCGDNLIWDGPAPTVIDFDDCLYHWYASDLATALTALRGEPRLQASLLRGYTEVRELTPDWEGHLEIFARICALGSLAWRRHAASLGVEIREGPSVRALRDEVLGRMPAL